MNESHNEANVGKFELIETDTSRDTYPISAKQNREFNLFLPWIQNQNQMELMQLPYPLMLKRKRKIKSSEKEFKEKQFLLIKADNDNSGKYSVHGHRGSV